VIVDSNPAQGMAVCPVMGWFSISGVLLCRNVDLESGYDTVGSGPHCALVPRNKRPNSCGVHGFRGKDTFDTNTYERSKSASNHPFEPTFIIL
jgi:hypothetical protein